MHYILLTLSIGFFFVIRPYFSARQQLKQLRDQSALLNDPVLLAMTAKLARAMNIKTVMVNIYDKPEMNGLATADGKIYMSRGFIDKYRNNEFSAAELTSVVAHEMGHIALGHAKRRRFDFFIRDVLTATSGFFFSRFFFGFGSYAMRAVSQLFMAKLSRKDEFEADAFATALMHSAGLGSAPQKALFAKLDRYSGKDNTPVWLRSHPKCADRIAAIEANEARW
ncbi:MAG: M48 family metalloprotease [Rhodobacteraceae bacterium]|nr:M48 family metalloprotease [Paracoccaceae bacterium]